MDLEWIEDFLVLATMRNFSSAASARNVSQPAFSRRIRALEHWLGPPLVDRGSYPVTLTTAGEHFRQSAQEIVRALHRTRDECRTQLGADASTLSFAALHTLALTFFPRWFGELQPQLGHTRVRMEANNVHDCVELLVMRRCDFLLCFSHPNGPPLLDAVRYPSITLSREVLVPVSAPNADGQPLHMLHSNDAGGGTPFLGYTSDCYLGKMVELILARLTHRPVLSLRYENSMSEAIKAMAVRGNGMAWLPESCARAELERGELVQLGGDELTLAMDIQMFRSNERLAPDAERLWSLLARPA